MSARLLVLHRKERYSGEHAPEILAVADEWIFDDNPEWWPTEVAKHKETVGNEAAAWAEVTVEIDQDALMAALYPYQEPIQAVVKEEH